MVGPERWWKSEPNRGLVLFLFTGLVVSWVRHGLQHHWQAFPSWKLFFIYWFVHTLGIAVFTLVAGAVIIGTHNFFLGYKWREDKGELMFYIVMTVLVGALSLAFLANYRSNDIDDEYSMLLQPYVGISDLSL